MEWSWLQLLLYGFISGFGEFLPVSAESHRVMLQLFYGGGNDAGLLRFCVHISALLAVLLANRHLIGRIRREQKIAALPPRKRWRRPDAALLMLWRMIKISAIPLLLSFLLYGKGMEYQSVLWLHSLLLVINGAVLYLPQFMLRGNKDARAMSPWDAVLIGASSALSMLPGISRTGMAASVGMMRGCDRRYAVDYAVLLSVPALIVMSVLDLFAFGGGATLGFGICVMVMAAAFAGGYLSVLALRFLSAKTGLAGFAYYSWGIALFMLILFLTI